MHFMLVKLLPVIFTIAMVPLPLLADAAKPTYVDDVMPVLRASCLSCHSDDKQKGGLNLATFAAVMQGGSSGAAVVPGKPEESRLYLLSNHSMEPKMPPKADKLAAANLEVFRKWIEQGARENSGSKVMAVKPVTPVTLSTTVKGRPAVPPMPGKLPVEPIVTVRKQGTITALAASPWAPLVAIAGSKQITLYHCDTTELLGVLPFPHGQIHSLKFSRNGQYLLVAGGHGGQSGKAMLFEIATGKVLIEVGQETDVILSADLSNDQSQIAVGSPSKVVRVYSTKDGSVIREIRKHTDWVTAVEFSPDGVLLASGDRNGGLFVWEANTGREFFTLKGPTAMVTSISWRDDANSLAVSGEDGSIRLYEMENGNQTKTWNAHPGGAASVRYAHDGRLVSTGRDRVTKLWDASGAQQKTFEAFHDLGLQAAISHDGSRIIAGDWTGVVKVWASADAKPLASLDANPLTPLQRAERAVAHAEANVKKTTDALAVAKSASEKATAEVAVHQKALNDATAANKTAQDAVAPAKAELAKQTAALELAKATENAKGIAHQALQEAAAKVQTAATKQPGNAELKTQAAKFADLAKIALAELETAKKVTAAAISAVKPAEEKLAVVQKAAQGTAAVIAPIQTKLTTAQSAAKPLSEAFASAQTRLTTSQTDLDSARKSLEKLKTTTNPKEK